VFEEVFSPKVNHGRVVCFMGEGTFVYTNDVILTL